MCLDQCDLMFQVGGDKRNRTPSWQQVAHTVNQKQTQLEVDSYHLLILVQLLSYCCMDSLLLLSLPLTAQPCSSLLLSTCDLLYSTFRRQCEQLLSHCQVCKTTCCSIIFLKMPKIDRRCSWQMQPQLDPVLFCTPCLCANRLRVACLGGCRGQTDRLHCVMLCPQTQQHV